MRVFSVDVAKQSVEFTKKDAFMKDDVPVFQSIKEVRKGAKMLSLIVAKNEHGYVVKTFGGIKGLLTFEDAGEDLKMGQVVKTYVLFKKKDKGVALTVSKKKASEQKESTGDQGGVSLDGQLPSEEQVAEFFGTDKYPTTLKATQDSSLVGQVRHFRLLEGEESSPYLLLKCMDAEKKSKNFLAVAPKCLLTNFAHDSPFSTISDTSNMRAVVL